MVANSIGSTWNKWDLHVHTPASLHQLYGGGDDAWEAFLTDLEKLPPDFKVIGINDYIFVDGYERVLKEKKENGRLKNIDLILPVVELRIDKFGGVVKKGTDGKYSQSDLSRVNIHIIFDQISPEVIRQQFLSAIAPKYHLIPEYQSLKGKWQAVITPDSIRELGAMIINAIPEGEKDKFGSAMQEGFNNLCISLDSINEALDNHILKGKYILAAGKAEWENVKWNDSSIAEKRNIINSVNMVFTASPTPAAYHASRKKLSESKVIDRLLDCSDAHSFSNSTEKDRIGNCFTWIKAETTFEGLKQSIHEFEQRVFIGDAPPKRQLIANNKTKYIKTLKTYKKDSSKLQEPWLDAIELPLNSDLVAIIGNKGSGKSALADILALVGNTQNYNAFSFLTEQRFREPKNNLAANFIGEIIWHDGTPSKIGLEENPNKSSVERVKYLPQSYLENLCNELAGGGSLKFDAELKKIIYTHVPEEERSGFSSLNELLNFNVSEIEKEKTRLLEDLSLISAEILEIERKSTSGFKEGLNEQLLVKKQELKALEESPPIPVEDPQESEASKQESHDAALLISELESQLSKTAQEEQSLRLTRAEAIKHSTQIQRALQSIKSYKTSHEQFINDLNASLIETGFIGNVAELVKLSIDSSPLQNHYAVLKKKFEEIDVRLADTAEGSLNSVRQKTEEQLKELKGKLGEKQRLFLAYKAQLTSWETAKNELIGDKNKQNTIRWLESELSALQELPNKNTSLQEKRLTLVGSIYDQLCLVVDEYRKLYTPVRSFVQSPERAKMILPLDFDVQISETGFQEEFLGRINRQVRGSFSGVEESNAWVKRTLQETNFLDKSSVIEFIKKIDDRLHFDRRSDITGDVPVSIFDQLRRGQTLEELYDFIYGLKYLTPRYSLTFGGQEISHLSPGERGLLLLVFYLLVDKDDIPLVIDQPEENLDNQTIFRVLVTCLKAAKQKRQIFMVTHNPNLAVVCDAEQIIYARCEKAEKRFVYSSGAIETPETKEAVVEILEGTEPAFVNRKLKYGF